MNKIKKNVHPNIITFLKKFHQNNNAQGTIEYLVIIAIVIVIGLIVVGISTNLFDTQQITQTNEQLKGQIGVGGITIIDAFSITNDTGLLNFKNNTGETITLTKITTDTGINEYNNPKIAQGNTELIELTNTCTCEPNQQTRTCEFQITYITKYGLEKTITQTTITQCNSTIQPEKQPIQPKHQDCFNLEQTPQPNPIPICTLNDLNKIRGEYLDKNFILINNIDASDTKTWNDGNGWEPIGTCGSGNECHAYPTPNYEFSFRGDFNGNNKIISNIHIYRPAQRYIGFFGHSSGNISNVGIVDHNIIGNQTVGGLIGESTGNVLNSFTSGNTQGTIASWAYLSYVGGLIGSSSGNITNTYTTGNVTGYNTTGGLIGYFSGDLSNSYSISNVTATEDFVGGLVGNLTYGNKISNSFATGEIIGINPIGGLIGNNSNGTITNSYWDSELTKQEYCYTTQSGTQTDTGCKKTINQETDYFGSGGIPFDPLKLNWSPDIWEPRIDNYPILKWQIE
ncbi:MAG: hypothetical protein PHX27_00700 [Candidatus ainarchaeum sp.]|nr:hypothetical protein [Candidatus ainarchaeum sp.]